MPEGRFIPGIGNPNAKLLILGEAPGAYEESRGIPFCGPSGAMLDSLLEENNFSRDLCYITNVIKYRPPDNKLKRLAEIGLTVEECYPPLYREIAAVNPNCILALGNIALKAMTGFEGIHKWRGSVLQSFDGKWKLVPTLHPANLLPGPKSLPYQAKAYITLDIRKAIRESNFKEYRVPKRDLRIAKSSLEVYRYFQEIRSRGWRNPQTGRIRVAADIETPRSIPACISFAYSPTVSMCIPLLNLRGDKEIAPFTESEQLSIIKLVAEFADSEDIEFVWQNGKFDRERMLNTWMIKFRHNASDTSLLAHTIYPEFPKGLDFLGSIFTDEPYWKDDGKKIDWLEDSKGKAKKNYVPNKKKLFLYNAKDSACDFEILIKQEKEMDEYGLREFFYGYVMKLDGFYSRMESRGLKVNEERRADLLHKYLDLSVQYSKEIYSILGRSVNWRSPKMVIDMIEGLGFKCPMRRDKDGNYRKTANEDALVSLISNHCNTSSDRSKMGKRLFTLISMGRRVDKTISTYLLSPPDYDGRMRTVYRIAVTEEGKNGGTETGRTSTSKQEPPVRPEELGMAFQTITTHGDIGADVREIYEADEGYVFIEADMSQAEARFCAAYSNDDETLKRFDTEDIHKRTASWAFGVPYEQIDKKDPRRQVGKTTRYLGQYDGQKARLMQTLMSDSFRYHIDLSISEWKCGKVLETFHQFTPKIKAVFHKSVQECLEKDRTLITPHGRRRQFFARWDDNLFREAYPYLCSATTKDHLTMAMLRLEERKPETLFMIEKHDGFLVMVKEDEVDWYKKAIKEELEVPINFDKCSLKRKPLVIPCEMKIGKNYGEMVDLK